MRFFRSASDKVYEQARATLDAAWGLPDGRGTTTCITPASEAPHDASGRIVLAVQDALCDYEAVAAVLPGLLASGAVEEIDEATYRAAIPQTP